MYDKPYCGCGDEITADDPGACGTCNSLKDEQFARLCAELAAAQANVQTLRDALLLLRCPEWAEKVQDEYAAEFDQFVAGALRRALPGDDATLLERIAREVEPVRKDAERYRWLRQQQWNEAALCVVARPKVAVKLGHDCPTLDRLDVAIDAAIQKQRSDA